MTELNLRWRASFGAAALAALVGIAGCQSGATSRDDNGVAGVDATAAPPPTERITESELRAYCPRATIRQGTAAFNTYAKGGNGDATKIIYQASMSDTTRSCSRADGNLTIKVAVAGRVVPGPLGQAGKVTMPIRVAVTQDNEVLYSQLFRHEVAIADAKSATQFVFTDPNIVIPMPQGGQPRVFIGFDEGPEKPTKAAAVQ